MSTAVIEKPKVETGDFADALRAAPLDGRYLARTSRYEISIQDMASRIQDAFGHLYTRGTNGELYLASGEDLPTEEIRTVLSTVGLDIVLEGILGYGTPNPRRLCTTEFDAAYEARLLNGPPNGATAEYHAMSRYEAKKACMAAVNSLIETPDFRTKIGVDISEIF